MAYLFSKQHWRLQKDRSHRGGRFGKNIEPQPQQAIG